MIVLKTLKHVVKTLKHVVKIFKSSPRKFKCLLHCTALDDELNIHFNMVYLKHSKKKRKHSLETRAELSVQRTYVENQTVLDPILLFRASKRK